MTAPVSLATWHTACATLESLGVSHAFGVPGTQTVGLYEALRRSALTTVLPTSELTAAFMAGAFYKSSGRPAALVTIPGPGFAFAVPGLAESRADSSAVLHLTLAAPEGADAPFRLQALPQSTLASVLAKGTCTIGSEADVAPMLRTAYDLATQGEPGPVVVTFAPGAPSGLRLPISEPETRARALVTIEESWARLRAARRPLVLAGQGAIESATALAALVEAIAAPLLVTPGARGLLREDHPLVMPFDPYRGGHEAIRALVARADLVLVLGAKLGHNGTAGHSIGLGQANLLQVESDPSIAGRAYGNDAVLASCHEWFAAQPAEPPRRSAWTEDEVLAAHAALREPPIPTEPLVAGEAAADFFRRLRTALPANAMVVTDTGQHQILARRHFDVLSPRGFLTPSDFQSMGFGLPAAIAARMAAPDRPVVAVVGDGSLAITGLELATASALGITLPVLVFADGFLNQIRMHQAAEYGFDSGVRLAPIDLPALAAATGAAYGDAGDLEETLAAAFHRHGPTLITVPVEDSLGNQRIRLVRRAKEGVRAVANGLRRRLSHIP